jgi:tetratricopeptide (TPR) repeat protein
LDGIEDAGRALAARGDDPGERALQRLKEGDAAEAKRLFAEQLEAEAKAVSERRIKAAETARHLAALAKPKDVVEAAEYYKRATEFDAADPLTWFDYADTVRVIGRSGEAKAAFQHAAAKAKSSSNVIVAYWATLGLGDVAKDQGDLSNARQYYKTAAAIAEPIAKCDPGNADWQRDLSVSYAMVAAILEAQGNLDGALDGYRKTLAIQERLAEADPGNAGWQRDLSVAQENIGDVLKDEGNLPAALESFRASLAIAERLAKSDPGNAGWQRDLSVARKTIGDVLKDEGNLRAALESYKADLAIAERLAR